MAYPKSSKEENEIRRYSEMLFFGKQFKQYALNYSFKLTFELYFL